MPIPYFFDEAYLNPLIIWGCSLLFGILLDRYILRWVGRYFIEDDSITHIIIKSLIGKATYICFFLSLYIAIQIAPLSPEAFRYGSVLSLITLIYIFTKTVSEIAVNAIKTVNEDSKRAYKSYSIIINLVRIVFFCIGLLIILKTLHISITPILTALGVASLAVALALQDTLGNLFSGISVIAGKRIKPGHYVRLDSGHEGIIEDISWRSTVIRETNANRVVVPNQKIASAIVTNYSLIDQHVLVRLPVGIAYTSDLDLVERVTREEAKKIQNELLGSEETFEPIFRYTGFDSSAVNFLIIAKAPDYSLQFILIDKLIRAIHKRFIVEKIDIPFPTQNVILKKEE